MNLDKDQIIFQKGLALQKVGIIIDVKEEKIY